MKCDLCKKNEACMHFKQVYEGAEKEIFVCADCAAEKGLDAQSPLSLTNFLFGMGIQPESKTSAEDKKCRGCGLRASEFRKVSRLGCATCYEVFAEDLKPILASMHKGKRHVGKVPAGEKATTEIAGLQIALAEAVASQNFEEAARLRDQIGALRKPGEKAN